MEPNRARLEEVKEWLNAYRQGFVCYDRAHVLQLQAERVELERADYAAHCAGVAAAEHAGY